MCLCVVKLCVRLWLCVCVVVAVATDVDVVDVVDVAIAMDVGVAVDAYPFIETAHVGYMYHERRTGLQTVGA